MDSELLLKFIGYFPDYLSALSSSRFTLFLDNLCRNSCKLGQICELLTKVL